MLLVCKNVADELDFNVKIPVAWSMMVSDTAPMLVDCGMYCERMARPTTQQMKYIETRNGRHRERSFCVVVIVRSSASTRSSLSLKLAKWYDISKSDCSNRI